MDAIDLKIHFGIQLPNVFLCLIFFVNAVALFDGRFLTHKKRFQFPISAIPLKMFHGAKWK